MHKVFANGVVEVQNLGDFHIFTINGQNLNIYLGGEVSSEKVLMVLAES